MAKYVPPFKKDKMLMNTQIDKQKEWQTDKQKEYFCSSDSKIQDNMSNIPNRWARDSSTDNFRPRDSSMNNFRPRDSSTDNFRPNSSMDNFRPRTNKYEPRASQVHHLTQQVNNIQLDDFPSLPQNKQPQNKQQQQPQHQQPQQSQQPNGRMTYAALAANWAEQVKENEEKAKKVAEEEEENRLKQEKLNEIKILTVTQGLVPKKHTDSDDDIECDIGCHVSNHSSDLDNPDNYEVDADIESEEEEEVEDPDAFWTQRKNRNDLY